MDNILNRIKYIHFVGIGGISMSSIAFVLKNKGYVVSGSDINKSYITDQLQNAGIKIFIGHSENNISDNTQLLVYTADVHEDNCELKKAKQLGIPCLVRAKVLGLLMSSYKTPIGISGTHGKSTTTSMLSDIFTQCNADPTVLSGAELSSNNGAAYRIGANDYFIFEACEYTESFLNFYPKTALILNVERDHLDYYNGIEQIISAFSKFADLTTEYGTVIYNADCKNTIEAVRNYKGKKISFGIENEAKFCAKNIKYISGSPSFDIFHNGNYYASLNLSVFGSHNVMNALAAIACAYNEKLPLQQTVKALNLFGGAKRRFEFIKKCNGADIISDYAHHPTEITTTLEAAMKIGYSKVVCIFQPHTFTRTYEFKDGFVKALSICDKTILAPVYAKRDINTHGVDSKTLVSEIPNAIYIKTLHEIAEYIKQNAKENEAYILMGAGDINKISDML